MPDATPQVAFVLGGGGVLGSTQIGMLRGLFEAGIRPDLVLGTSVGALNGAMIASDPTAAVVDRLSRLWQSLSDSGVFSGSVLTQLRNAVQSRTYLHSSDPLRRLITAQLGDVRIEDLAVHFECVAAHIETASATWFSRGSVADAVIASCAVPGLLPPAEIDGQHFLDGGLVHSIPVGRAVALGASVIYVLQVGRAERPLEVPRWPWEVGLVAFEIARRHRYVEELATIPDGTTVHVLPSGESATPLVSVRYRDAGRVAGRIDRAYAATQKYLAKSLE